MSENDNVLRFSSALEEVPVEISDKDGTATNYVLREMIGGPRDTYLNKMADRVKYTNGQVTGLKTFDGFQSSLLGKCLWTNTEGEEQTLVSINALQTFPARVLTQLYNKAVEMSGLDEGSAKKKAEEAKND